jgi:hypothetical protein
VEFLLTFTVQFGTSGVEYFHSNRLDEADIIYCLIPLTSHQPNSSSVGI